LVYFLSATASLPALADRYDNAIVQEVSSSGQTVVINVGTTLGLQQKTPILIRRGDEKIVAARIVRAEEDRSVAYIVEKFSESGISAGEGYTLLWSGEST
jgi:ribonuclease HII